MKCGLLPEAVREREMERRLLKAAINGNKQELLDLLQEDSGILDRAMSKCKEERKDNPLHIAALYTHSVDFVKEILSQKWELTRQLNSQGQSPLHLATVRGQVEVVTAILDIDPGACFVRDLDGMIPLHLAAIKGRVQVLEKLFEAEKTSAFVLTERGDPILHLCAKNNQIEAFKKLMDLVGNDGKHDDFLNLKDSDDNTILHVLSTTNQIRDAWLLVKNKVGAVLDVNAENKDGFTPLEALIVNKSGFGYSGFFMFMSLRRAGANAIRKKLLPTAIELSENTRWVGEVLPVVAVLNITVAFQAGINPPGGFWQGSGKYNGAVYKPGQSVMRFVDPKSYRDFYNLNTVTFLASLFAVIMLMSGRWNRTFQFSKNLGIFFTCVSIATMLAAYLVASSFLSPDKYYKSPRVLIYWGLFEIFFVAFFFANYGEFIRLLRWILFLKDWSAKELMQYCCGRRFQKGHTSPPATDIRTRDANSATDASNC